MYKLSRIEQTDIFFLAKENIELLGDTFIKGTFAEVLSFASILKENAIDVGSGDLHEVALSELSNIVDTKWYLQILPDRYQITRTSDTEVYNLPTSFLNAFQGSLDDIFVTIVSLESN